MDQIDRIVRCDLNYYRCFSRAEDTGAVLRFRDPQLNDMYDHNFTYFKHSPGSAELNRLVEAEASVRIAEGADFLNVTLQRFSDASLIDRHPETVSRLGFYVLDPRAPHSWSVRPDVAVLRMADEHWADELFKMDVLTDGEFCGADFCRRRVDRKGRVYLSDTPLDCYLGLIGDQAVGRCELFLDGNAAKIEDFVVLPQFRRRGVGTAILKALTDTALASGADLIYLCTDEDDTAKEMYQKLGFVKSHEKATAFFKL